MNNFDSLMQGYLAGGLSLVPCGKDKRPTVKWKEFQTRQPTSVELGRWLREGSQSFAAIGGRVSGGLEIIDFDDNPQATPLAYAAVDFFEAWRDEVGSLVEQYKLVVQRTGGGGFQVAYRCATPDPNQKLAWVQDETQEHGRSIAIETRGEGGYAIVAPSLHPSGNRYRMILGDFADVPTIPQKIRNRLLDAARGLDLMPYTSQELVTVKHEKKQASRQADNEQVSVIDTFNANNKISDILARYGYTRGGHGRYSRPGKEDSLGVAVLDADNVSFHWSSNDPLHKTNTSGKPLPVDPFDVHVVMEHHGNVREATKDAAAKLGIKRQVHTNGHSAQQEAPDWATKPAIADEPTAPRKDDQKSTSQQAQANDESYLLTEGAHDTGNARCIYHRYKDQFAHNEEYGWMRYDGKKWVRSGAEEALDRAVVETLEARIGAALKSGQMEHHKAVVQISIPTRGHILSAKYCLTSILYVPYSEFETNPDLLNCQNGTIDLRTGELLPHNPKHYIMHCSSVDYDPNADTTVWLSFINGAVGEDVAPWLQMASGYGLTGHTREEVLFYLFGPARSGKGTFTEAILSLLGTPLADVVSFYTLTAPREADTQNFNLAPLHSARFLAASESNAYERFNEAKVKQLTGGDKIQCSFKHKTPFSYRPRYKIWLSSNQPINADPDDDAVWGRIRAVHFPNSHLDSEDKQFKEQMRSEAVLRGALAWCVEGAKKWYALGGKGLQEPQKNKDLKDEQRAELDHVGVWIEENCETFPGYFTPSAVLYTNYSDWCKANGVSVKQQKAFSQALKHKGYTDKLVKHEGKPKRGFYGLKIA